MCSACGLAHLIANWKTLKVKKGILLIWLIVFYPKRQYLSNVHSIISCEIPSADTISRMFICQSPLPYNTMLQEATHRPRPGVVGPGSQSLLAVGWPGGHCCRQQET